MDQEGRFMIIKIGTEHYGLKIDDVKEVVPNTEITNVYDKASVYIYGIMKCRYGCVSVLDIYKLFHREPISERKNVIIVVFDERLLAFPIEKVECVVDVLPEKLYDIPQFFNSTSQQYIQMLIKPDDKLIPIINTKGIFEKVGILSEKEVISE